MPRRPKETPLERVDTQLYRHFDEEGNLLYVGISVSALERLARHRTGSRWFRKIAKVTKENFSSREEALAAETLAIQSEFPKHNKQQKLSQVVEAPDAQPQDKRRAALTSQKGLAKYFHISLPLSVIENVFLNDDYSYEQKWSFIDYYLTLRKEGRIVDAPE